MGELLPETYSIDFGTGLGVSIVNQLILIVHVGVHGGG